MANFSEISFWKQNFGLLPLHLKDVDEERFLMLNGGYGDFCLQTFDDTEHNILKQYSWSANTKNYLIVGDENIKIVNWLEDKPDVVSKSAVENNLSKFYKYLLSKSYKTPNDVVPFIIDIFKQLRNETIEKENPKEAISLLFQLLISLKEDNLADLPPMFFDFDKAELPSSFEMYRSKLISGVKSIEPDLDLILRHTSGALFQEAHKEVLYFDLQRDLFGGVSSKLVTKNKTYSSIHYTPPYLARTIVENALKAIDLSSATIKILDPSCGSSEFLIEILKQLKFLKYTGKITLVGFDSSVSAIETSNFLLHYENQTQWNGKIDLQIQHVDDSLLIDWGIDNDLILMNPPFVSWEQLKNKRSRDLIKDVLGNKFTKGKPNQASAFFFKATESLTESGVIGCVLPSSILTFDSYKKLRDDIREKFDLKLLAKLGNYVFEDALTDVSVFIGKKPQSLINPKVIWTKNEKGIVPEALRELRKLQINNESAKIEAKYNIYTPSIFPLSKGNWNITSYSNSLLSQGLNRFTHEGILTYTSNLFKINQGAILGLQNVFTITEDQYKTLPKQERKYFRKALTTSSFNYGRIIINEYVWYPYDNNGLSIKTEDELLLQSFGQDRLLQFKDSLSSRKGIKNWWELTRPRNWQFKFEPRLYSARFGSSKSFGFDKLGETVVLEGNAFIPKIKFKDDYYFFYLAIFSSDIYERLLSIYSKPLLAGYDLGKIQIKDIPIPDVRKIDKDSTNFKTIVYLGKELEKGNSSVSYMINEEVQIFYPKLEN
jgi:adenine-specific DNA-methyltransferase